jgi:hypothetical protein
MMTSSFSSSSSYKLFFIVLLAISAPLLVKCVDSNNINNNVEPLFQCWFETYTPSIMEGGKDERVYNLVMGYENTQNNDVIYGIGNEPHDMSNTIIPFSYNGIQPIIFKSSLNSFVFVISDSLKTLTSNENGVVEWHLAGKKVVVTHQNITTSEESQCKVKYSNVCPLWIDHFCEDSNYCNGRELCFSHIGSGSGGGGSDLQTSHGVCVKSSQKKTCESSSYECSESELTCKLITPNPTTIQPTTESPTTLSPVVEEEPTVLVEKECTINEDCKSFSSFCYGDYKCDSILNKCIPKEIDYTPCQKEQKKLDDFYKLITTTKSSNNKAGLDSSVLSKNDHNETEQGGLVVTCVEHLRLCVESFYCLQDVDCDDGNICNGLETCNQTKCSSAKDQSIETVCGSSSMICLLDQGCVSKENVPTSSVSSSELSTGVIVLIIVICIGVFIASVVVILLALRIHYKKVKSKNHKK